MAQYTITLTDEEEKAWRCYMLDVETFLLNAQANRTRRLFDRICRLALEDDTHTILTLAEKRWLRDYLDAQGIILTSIARLPDNVKALIVNAARVKSVVAINDEFEAQTLRP